jgi:phage/plasmid-associated DNA primase
MRARRLLRDAIFNWSSDSDQRTFGRRRTGVFKRIVSGESVTDRKLGEDVKENYNIPFLIFNLNELPYADDQSLGFIRRLQFISFDVSIPKERQNPDIMNQSRCLRIAKGSGTKIDEVNRLMKQFDQTRKMMRMVSGMGSSKMAQMAAAMKMKGGMPKF